MTGMAATAILPAAAGAADQARLLGGAITEVPGVRAGHFTHGRRPTGCTVVSCRG